MIIALLLLLGVSIANAYSPNALTIGIRKARTAWYRAQPHAIQAYDDSKILLWNVSIYLTALLALLLVAILCGYPTIQLILVAIVAFHSIIALGIIALLHSTVKMAMDTTKWLANVLAKIIPPPIKPTEWWHWIISLPYNFVTVTLSPTQASVSTLVIFTGGIKIAADGLKLVKTILGGINLGLFFLATIYLWDYKWRIETVHDGFGMTVLFLIALIWGVMYVAFETKYHMLTPQRVAVLSTILLLTLFLGVVNPTLAKGLGSLLGNAGAAVQKFTVLSGYKTHTGTTLYAKTKGETPVLVKNDGEKNVWFSESSAPALVAGQVLFAGEDPESIESDGRKLVRLYPCGDAADKKCLKSRAPLARWVWIDSADLEWLAEQPPLAAITNGVITNDQNIVSNAPALGCEVGRVGDNGVEETELHVPACFNHQFRLRDGVKRLTPTIDPAAPVAWRGRKATPTGGFGPGEGTQRPNLGAGVLLIKINTGVFEAFIEPRDIPQGGIVTLAVNGDANQKSYTGRYVVQVEHY